MQGRGRVENGARGSWRAESGKHGEASDFTRGRNKGVSRGGLAIGDRRWEGRHTTFVDGLPAKTTKRDLYKLLGRNGFIIDIFISRKVRINKEGTFAFVRFKEYRGVMNAVENMNGVSWQGRVLTVCLARARDYHNKLQNSIGIARPE
ncbi:hypothetical protein PIB30_086645 [Stylosanthes scabra]|uniref:RRM domain-containing protein n=1 Tax=Stylosanthes scabra TaxID=79078 RepID=A0ABU6UWX2_9FABA|nr:hypothetical protein [Stylosanthes scabra]